MSSTRQNQRLNDNYPTPNHVVNSLLKHIEFRPDDTFLEPCRGSGAIFNKIPLADDQKYWCEIEAGRDYFKAVYHSFLYDVIITNPPFSFAAEFLEKSFYELQLDGTLIYLQRLNFLGSIKRQSLWKKIGYPDKVVTIVPRPCFINNKSDSCEYAWFIWDQGDRVKNLNAIDSILTK